MTIPTLRRAPHEGFHLSPQQISYFTTFGFLRLPGLFRDDVAEIRAGFERVFADPRHEQVVTHNDVHGRNRRIIVLGFLEKDATLQRLLCDPRVTGVVQSLVGDDYEYRDSDGNLWDCETYWHFDAYKSPLSTLHIKLSFYLDSLHADSGAIRLIPGSNFYTEAFAKSLHRDLTNHEGIKAIYGVEGREIPCWIVENEPGDLIVWNQRTMHASYNGANRRRSFALTFRKGIGEDLAVRDDLNADG